MKRLIIIGVSGHGKVVAEIAALNGYRDIVFLDDDESVRDCHGYPVIGKPGDSPEGELFVAVGNAENRKRLMALYTGRHFPVLIHPRAVLSSDAAVGEGSVIMAGAVINPGAAIGRGGIVNTCASVDHDCTLGSFVHVAVGAHLCGTVEVGDNTWIGAGATVSNNVSICADCMIGAGAVVVKSITEKGTYIGVPAKKMSK